MKLLKLSVLAAAVAAFAFLGACGEDTPETPLTDAQKISKTWVISDTGDPSIDGTGFTITFNSDTDGNATTYVVSPGSLSAGQRPNYASTSNSGSWSITGSQITFEPGGAGESTVSVTNLSETTLTFSWTVPIDIDKNEPTYTYDLVPQ